MAPLIPLAFSLAKYAPDLIKLFSGSDKKAEIATKVIEVAQAVTGIASPQGAVSIIEQNPAKANEFTLTMAEKQGEMERAYLGDTQSARARDVELARAGLKNHRANVLAGAALLLVIICLFIVIVNSGADDFAKATISLILGRALGWVEQLFSFEFGTTRANKTKDDTINQLSK